ncbi:nitrogen assimilation transcription factor nit-4 [Podospora aff. communis PSN243]|uniref:Nitrogen assimilation transcription factor nit-4 n=1 Tax=Podospora aff. communis PSN243 TaxID=3040156 RepID=A0AAV9GQE3_9PEZI|nr:nitrogen assimilation transcription factor nit-4 [Podospora aff. communis PSN243]
MAPQSSFRSIQPAMAILADPTQKRDKLTPWSAGSSLDKRSKRFKSVTQACNTCRRHKARCDGGRPRCGACTSKGKPCGYEGEAGQSRQAAIKARLEALEKLLNALQSKPQEEAQRLLQHIRSVDDIVSLSGQVGDVPPSFNAALVDGLASGSVSCPSSTSRGSSPQTVGHGDSPPVLQPPEFTAQDPDSLIRFILPKEDATRAAVRNFYACSGGLFHAFPQYQIEEYCRGIFDKDYRLDVSQRVAICCVSCVAAVGVQYYPTGSNKNVDRSSAALLYDISRHYFADILEEQPLEAIKVCAILAMYNVLEKSTAGLAYVEAGMGMSQRFATPGSPCVALLNQTQWEEFRIAWRMLLFLSSWLSSTLGYISESDDTSFQIVVPEASLEHDHNTPIGEIAQAEMTKISLLQARILRSHLALKVLTPDALDSALQTLQTWHETLPPQLLLANLGRTDMSEQDRRTIFYAHLLYLGAIILVYRRVVSQVVQDSRVGTDINLPTAAEVSLQPLAGILLSQADKGMFAAKYTARILGLLLANRGIVQRCWLVIFQAHTSCVVILHSVAQKQLHNFPPAMWSDDLEHAQLCLDTLKYCGTIDPVALRFYNFLSEVYDKLASVGARRELDTQAGDDGLNQWASMPPDLPLKREPVDIDSIPPAAYLTSAPAQCDPDLKKLSFSLLRAVCRPWDDPIKPDPDQKPELPDMSRSETCSVDDSQRMKPDWDFEDKSSFRWDTEAMGMKCGEGVAECCFIGSEVPSGWSDTVVDIEVDDTGVDGDANL